MKVRWVMLCLLVGGWSGTGGAQIPVTDAAAIANAQGAHVESIAKYIEQIRQLKLQVEQLRQQYAALTGGRGLGEILNDPRLRQYLPEDWQRVYDAIRSGGYEGLTGPAREIYDANRVYDSCAGLVAEARQTCEAQAVKPAPGQGLCAGGVHQGPVPSESDRGLDAAD